MAIPSGMSRDEGESGTGIPLSPPHHQCQEQHHDDPSQDDVSDWDSVEPRRRGGFSGGFELRDGSDVDGGGVETRVRTCVNESLKRPGATVYSRSASSYPAS